MRRAMGPILVQLAAAALAVAAAPADANPAVVIWHGLGDAWDSDGMELVTQAIHNTTGGYTLSISMASSAEQQQDDEDRRAGFMGSIDEQVARVCQQLKHDESLRNGFHAMGFSQGGQFLRAYVERCNDPPVRSLITWGSQHFGINDLPDCESDMFWCRQAQNLIRWGVWNPWVQSHVIQAQYFRDTRRLDQYLEHSAFLADINNERADKNPEYKKRLATLERFVMIRFANDTTVRPLGSSWFDDVNAKGGQVALREHPIYTEDWLGLRELDEQGRLLRESLPGQHMQFNMDDVKDVVTRHVMGPSEQQQQRQQKQQHISSQQHILKRETPRTLKTLSMFEVLYDSESYSAYVMACISMIPQAVFVAYAVLAFWTRETRIAMMAVGQVACELLNFVLKRMIKGDRPPQLYGHGYGMPSSHAQFMGYFATYILTELVHAYQGPGNLLHSRIGAMRVLQVLAVTAAVLYSRIGLQYHTPIQVLAGVILGIVFAIVWRALCGIAYTSGLINAALDTRLCEMLCVKDTLSQQSSRDRLRDEWVAWKKMQSAD